MHDTKIQTANIGSIDRPDPPVRGHFDEKEMAGLVASIKENGVLTPLLVVRRKDRFEVVDGDRRLNACWQAGLKEIPIVVATLDDKQVHIQRMLANMDRHDPDPVSEAKYVARLITEETFTTEKIAKKLGRSISWVGGRMLIAEMPEYLQEALTLQQIKLGVAIELHQVLDERTKLDYVREAIRNGMTVHAAQYNKELANETIKAIQERGEEVEPDAIPAPVAVPQARCAITDKLMPINLMRMVRVGVAELDEVRAEHYQRRSSPPTG